MASTPLQLSFFHDERPAGLTYLENYVSEDCARDLVRSVDASAWRTDLKRRVQHYGYRYDYKARQARKEDYLGPLPAQFQRLADRLTAEGHFARVPDQVIVNEYQPGQGISAHIDCQPCFGEVITSLSLLSACVMRLSSQVTSRAFNQYLLPNSLLILRGQARREWTHAIPSRMTDVVEGQKHRRSRRISLTFRTMNFDR